MFSFQNIKGENLIMNKVAEVVSAACFVSNDNSCNFSLKEKSESHG